VKKADDKTLWEAQELIAARCHPDDGEIITPLLCFAAYVPMQVRFGEEAVPTKEIYVLQIRNSAPSCFFFLSISPLLT
jgi:hypothetical protein